MVVPPTTSRILASTRSVTAALSAHVLQGKSFRQNCKPESTELIHEVVSLSNNRAVSPLITPHAALNLRLSELF
eukprot:6473308-Amphidinium_carterae.1